MMCALTPSEATSHPTEEISGEIVAGVYAAYALWLADMTPAFQETRIMAKVNFLAEAVAKAVELSKPGEVATYLVLKLSNGEEVEVSVFDSLNGDGEVTALYEGVHFTPMFFNPDHVISVKVMKKRA